MGGRVVVKSSQKGSGEGTREEHMGVVREVVTPGLECRLVSLARQYEGIRGETRRWWASPLVWLKVMVKEETEI
jgi:hypothetical protein